MDRVDEVLALLRQDNSLAVTQGAPSQFKDTLRKLLPKGDDAAYQAGEEIIDALEVLISRQMTDSQRIISACVALSQITGMPIAKVIKKVELATGHLKLPSPSWVAKNIRAAKVVASHPGLAEIDDVEKIATLKRLPEEKLKEASETGTIDVSGRQVDIKRASRKEVGKAVREVVELERGPGEPRMIDASEALASDDDAPPFDLDDVPAVETKARATVPERRGASHPLSRLKDAISQALAQGLGDDEEFDTLRDHLEQGLAEIKRLETLAYMSEQAATESHEASF